MILSPFSLMMLVWWYDVSYKIVLSQYIAPVGSAIALPCNVSDWDRKAILLMLWYKDKQRVPLYSVDARGVSLDEAKKSGFDPRIILNETLTATTPYLMIRDVKDSDEGEYRCRVDYRDDKTQHSIISLQVVDLPKVGITLGAKLNANTIKEGIDVILECNLISKLPVNEITWLLNQQTVSSDQSNGLLVLNHSLVLQKVKQAYRGQYQCQASNTIGMGISDPFFLRVQYAPRCKSSETQKTFPIGHTERAMIRCLVESDPDPLEFKWWMNSSTHGAYSINNFTQNGTESVIFYSPRNKYGYGSVFCSASNAIGEQSEPCRFDIVAPEAPEKLKNCQIQNRSSSSLLIECDSNKLTSTSTTYILKVFKAKTGDKFVSMSNAEKPYFLIENLSSDERYDLHIFARTSGGESRPFTMMANLEAAKMSQNRMKNESFDDDEDASEQGIKQASSPLLIIIIVSISVSILTILMIVIIVRVKSNRIVSQISDPNGEDQRQGISPRIYMPDFDDSKVLASTNLSALEKNFTNGDIKCLEKTMNYHPADTALETLLKLCPEAIFDTNAHISKPDHHHLSPSHTSCCGELTEEMRFHGLTNPISPSITSNRAIHSSTPSIPSTTMDQDCRARISLISEACNHLIPDQKCIQLDGCSESESSMMKNLKISCDGSDVTLSAFI
ncbi:cell adhesion molecule Dscam2-like isoform X2 [Brevipalpus obovatus]|uniref:cell adhesion molecule Dscam2-like isoform X2 n=1 Tax=Brevipalpus obovatus TaxID=246614 RepID=UPI003D9F3E0A